MLHEWLLFGLISLVGLPTDEPLDGLARRDRRFERAPFAGVQAKEPSETLRWYVGLTFDLREAELKEFRAADGRRVDAQIQELRVLFTVGLEYDLIPAELTLSARVGLGLDKNDVSLGGPGVDMAGDLFLTFDADAAFAMEAGLGLRYVLSPPWDIGFTARFRWLGETDLTIGSDNVRIDLSALEGDAGIEVGYRLMEVLRLHAGVIYTLRAQEIVDRTDGDIVQNDVRLDQPVGLRIGATLEAAPFRIVLEAALLDVELGVRAGIEYRF